MKYKISIIGMGYVGCGNALMLSKRNEVSIVDIDENKIKNFNNGQLPINDAFAQQYFENEDLHLSATCNLNESIQSASFIILSLPTNFDETTKQYDTKIIEEVIEHIILENTDALIVLKSTVNIGYTKSLNEKFGTKRIIFSPEFLREGHALEDNLFPSRVIVGGEDEDSKLFGKILCESSSAGAAQLLLMESTAAESVKLFSNTYLAMRVAYFNELDGFCMDNNINTKDVITGVSLDNRIGEFYNNPSFGFGGYCLPKDSKQLLNRFSNSPHDLVNAIQSSNHSRIEFLSQKIIEASPKTVGIYKLAMKEGSDNSRDSSILKIIDRLLLTDIEIIVFDESIDELHIKNITLVHDFYEFANASDLIITNRLNNQIKPFSGKIFSRDIFSSDE
ncbi:nucleotide sugar dehydrogenase [Gammaproteobacteria bacterium]|nr:nucleotide sugar dehydrogenase [Gammaproteobacteria bacterium]MDC1361107.1 nucleotide sugar dehydrogenase [Gammaproteobacteria bacterium]